MAQQRTLKQMLTERAKLTKDAKKAEFDENTDPQNFKEAAVRVQLDKDNVAPNEGTEFYILPMGDKWFALDSSGKALTNGDLVFKDALRKLQQRQLPGKPNVNPVTAGTSPRAAKVVAEPEVTTKPKTIRNRPIGSESLNSNSSDWTTTQARMKRVDDLNTENKRLLEENRKLTERRTTLYTQKSTPESRREIRKISKEQRKLLNTVRENSEVIKELGDSSNFSESLEENFGEFIQYGNH